MPIFQKGVLLLKTTIITFFQKSTIPLKTEAKICTTVYIINFEARQRLKIGQVSAARTAQTQDRVVLMLKECILL